MGIISRFSYRMMGKGIPADIIEKVTDPYYTSRTTRKVGLGLPLFKQNAEMAGGEFKIDSEPGRGTVVKAAFKHDHLDRPPLGDIAGVIVILVSSNPRWTGITNTQKMDQNISLIPGR
jgi:hypothetical protein